MPIIGGPLPGTGVPELDVARKVNASFGAMRPEPARRIWSKLTDAEKEQVLSGVSFEALAIQRGLSGQGPESWQ
jgi:hypothetical protein